MGALNTNTDSLTSGKFRFKVLEDMSGKVSFLAFEYTHRDSDGTGKVSLVSSFKDTHKDSTLLTKLSLTGLPLNTSP